MGSTLIVMNRSLSDGVDTSKQHADEVLDRDRWLPHTC
jgi:hypothetical protein